MRGSFHVATVTGIPLKIHWSFGFLLLWVVYSNSRDGYDPVTILIAIGNVLSLVVCVILHEFGHALVARRFGVNTHDIIMTPIGGIARLERMPDGRGQEFWVALAGPAVNFAIALLILIGYAVATDENILNSSFWNLEGSSPPYFKLLLFTNTLLGLFNLIPAFPMDGGRILRSLLSLKMSRAKATKIASFAGQFIAICMFVTGVIFVQPIMALIGVFIFFTARQENQVQQRIEKMTKTTVSELMEPLQHLLHTGIRISDAIRLTENNPAESFIVWSRPGIPAGYITREQLNRLTKPTGEDNLIDAFIIPAPAVVPHDTPIANLIGFMQQHKLPVVIVSENNHYTGVVHWEKLSGYTDS